MPYASGKQLGARDSLFSRAWRSIRNWYEAGMPVLTGERSWVPAIIQDARFDQNFVTRRELLRRAE